MGCNPRSKRSAFHDAIERHDYRDCSRFHMITERSDCEHGEDLYGLSELQDRVVESEASSYGRHFEIKESDAIPRQVRRFTA